MQLGLLESLKMITLVSNQFTGMFPDTMCSNYDLIIEVDPSNCNSCDNYNNDELNSTYCEFY